VTATRTRARKGEGDLLREEILVAAERLLIETGSEDAVSIRAVADATGVTAPSIYRHFTDKNHLLFEVCARCFDVIDDVLQAAVAGIDDPVEAMRARGRAYVRFGMEHPEQYRIMFMGPSYEAPDQWDEILDSGSFAHLMEGLESAVATGHLIPQTDIYEMALHVWANIHGLTSLLVARPSMPWPDLDRFIDQHLELCMRSYLPPAR
jgi:AcrR family transcriptional regulator